MTLEQAITIYEAFDSWARLKDPQILFTAYTPDQVLEAQAIILSVAKQALFNSTQNNSGSI